MKLQEWNMTTTVKFVGVDENTSAVAVDISQNKISGIYPESFERKIVEDENTNDMMSPLPQSPPPAESAAILKKLEENTTPHIETW